MDWLTIVIHLAAGTVVGLLWLRGSLWKSEALRLRAKVETREEGSVHRLPVLADDSIEKD